MSFKIVFFHEMPFVATLKSRLSVRVAFVANDESHTVAVISDIMQFDDAVSHCVCCQPAPV